jgi:hypothetical protein
MNLQERALANPWGNASADPTLSNFEARCELNVVVGLSQNY